VSAPPQLSRSTRNGAEEAEEQSCDWTDPGEKQKRDTDLAREVAERQRHALARRLGVDVKEVKPCIAVIGAQPEGHRERMARVIALDLVRAGVPEGAIRSYLEYYAENCDQPPKAKERFSPREALGVLNRILAVQKRGRRIRGYGCKRSDSPLLPFCPYGAPAGRRSCPFVRGWTKPPTRDSITTLLGAFSTVMDLPVPDSWRRHRRKGASEAIILRRRFLWMAIGALEARKGHAGVEYIGSEAELAYSLQAGSRHTLRTDLQAMCEAGWIEYEPGVSWRATADCAGRRGCRVRRLLPVEQMLAEVTRLFPGAQEA